MKELLDQDRHDDKSAEPNYESPRIERVMTQDDLEREVMFAGPAITVFDGQQTG